METEPIKIPIEVVEENTGAINNTNQGLEDLRAEMASMSKQADDLSTKQKENADASEKQANSIRNVQMAIITANQAMQIAKQVYREIKQAIDATVGAYVNYASQVRELSFLNGTTAEDTSRLIQLTNNYKLIH